LLILFIDTYRSHLSQTPVRIFSDNLNYQEKKSIKEKCLFFFSILFDTKGDNCHQMKRKQQRNASLCHINILQSPKPLGISQKEKIDSFTDLFHLIFKYLEKTKMSSQHLRSSFHHLNRLSCLKKKIQNYFYISFKE
jgi:hypothetical protein